MSEVANKSRLKPSNPMTSSPTRKLAEYVRDTTFEDLPHDVVNRAKLFILDSIGCGLGGSTTALGSLAVRALSQQSRGSRLIIGRQECVNAQTSAFLNAMLINAMDYDESSPAGHLSATIVGALLALLRQSGVTGRDWLLSYVIGFEVCSRIAVATRPSVDRFSKVWGLGTFQTFGAVAAAAKLGNASEEQILNAMGIAGASAPVPSAQKWGWDNRPLSWIKDAVALPAQIGILATSLAESGFVGCRDILDGPKGFWRMAGSDKCDFEKMTAGLGDAYLLRNASFKTYPCCWFIHPTLDAIRHILDSNQLGPDDIERIDVRSLTDLAENFSFKNPKSLVDAQFSLPYCVAMLLLGVKTGPAWFDEHRFLDDSVLRQASKVFVHADERADSKFHIERRISSRISISAIDGEQFEFAARAPRGSPDNPIAPEAVVRKFSELANPVLGTRIADRVADLVLGLDRESCMTALPGLIGRSSECRNSTTAIADRRQTCGRRGIGRLQRERDQTFIGVRVSMGGNK